MIQRFVQQLVQLWSELSNAARIGIVGTAAACVLVVIGVGYWSAQPEYVVLASNLEPAQSREIIGQLESAGIACKLNFSSTTVWVDQRKVRDANLAVGHLVEPSSSGLDDLSSPFADPTTAEYRIRYQLEQRLAQSIMQLRAVDKATVHLGLPPAEPFIRDQKPATASVVVKLRAGSVFSRSQAQAIVSLLAHSVEGLSPEQITVVDTAGNVLSGEGGGIASSVSQQLEYRQSIERDLAYKAESMLQTMLGLGKAVVRVTADIDFTQVNRKERSFDPDGKVVMKERIETTTGTQEHAAGGGGSGGGGPVGTATNVPSASAAASSRQVVMKSETSDIDYDNSTIEETKLEMPGTIRRLTVAAMVQLDDPAGAAAAADGSPSTAPAVTQETIEQIVRQAVGFDPSRDDQIEVVVTNLAGATELSLLAEPAPTSTLWSDLLRNASLGLAALVALLLGYLMIRRLQPLDTGRPGDRQWSVERTRQVADLTNVLREHPELMAKVLSSWAGQTPPAPGAAPDERQRRAG